MPYTVKEPYLAAARNTTIEEMIKWMEKLETKGYLVYDKEYHAIRMLLEEHRESEAHPEPFATIDDALHQ